MKISIRISRPAFAALACFSAAAVGLVSCQGDEAREEKPPPRPPPLPFELPPGSTVELDKRNAAGEGYVLVRDAEGGLTVVWVKDRHRYRPEDLEPELEPAPEDAYRAGPYPGAVVDFEILTVPYHRLPDAVLEPYPDAGPDGEWSEEELKRYRESVELDEREFERVVLVTQEGSPPEQSIVVRIYDGQGRLLGERRKKGRFVRVIYQEDTGEKTFLVDQDGLLHWLVMDIQSGAVIVDSLFGLELDTPVVSIERVGESVVVIQRFRDGAWIRVRVFGSDGRLLHTLDIPGQYVSSTHNGRDLKAVAFQERDTVYQDLIRIDSGARASGVSGLPQNGIAGAHQHLQHDLVGGQDRFMEVVYDAGRSETVVRLLDGAGRIVATQVLPGRYLYHLKSDGKKLFALERPGFADAVGIDLLSGRQGPIRSLPGGFQRLDILASGEARLETSRGAVTFPLD